MNEQMGIPRSEVVKPNPYPNLRFEPGEHGANAWTNAGEVEATALYNSYINGNPYAHVWHPGLVRRIQTTQPKIIALDGLDFGTEFSNNESQGPTTTPASPDQTWLLLPTTPEKINHAERSIFVVNGDAEDIGDPFNYALLKYPDMQVLRTALNNKINTDSTTNLDSTSYAVLWTAGLIDLAIGASIAQRKIAKKDNIISRRSFLKGAAAVGTAVAAGAYFGAGLNSASEAATATTEAGKNFWLDIVDLVDPEIIKSKYEQMRTALLILKTKDAIDHLRLPRDVSSSVIMGSGHSFDAENFLDNDTAAQNTIRDYVDTINPIISAIINKYPQIKREFVVDKIKAFLSQSYVLEVKQPDQSAFWTPRLPQAVAAVTSTVADFRSKRVEASLENFS